MFQIRNLLTELIAKDPCAEVFDGNPALVQIPSEQLGYYVYGRVPGNHQNTGGDSSLIMVPDPNIEACNLVDEESELTSCPDDDLVALGLVTKNGAFDLVDHEFMPVDNSGNEKGKGQGKSKAINITELFLWTGDVCEEIFDTNGDGQITVDDVPADLDGDMDIDLDDLALYLETNCTQIVGEWVFSVADLVSVNHTITNDNVKLMKLRFYPVATTVLNG